MTKEEFIKKAKEFDYTDDDINEILKEKEEAEAKGLNVPFSFYAKQLVKAPLD